MEKQNRKGKNAPRTKGAFGYNNTLWNVRPVTATAYTPQRDPCKETSTFSPVFPQ